MTVTDIVELCEQLDAEFREYETRFQQNGEGPDFPAKALTGLFEVCFHAVCFISSFKLYIL